MKKLIFYFVLLLAAVWVGLKIAADPGYLLIAYQKVTVEMPLWLAVVAVFVLFLVLYFIFRLISNIRSLGSRISAWSRNRRLRRAFLRTQRGLILLAAGEWKQAEKDLNRAASRLDIPAVNYLACAYSAQAQGMIVERDDYLGKIKPVSKTLSLALGLTQAKLQIKQNQYEQALASLQQIQHIAPKNSSVLKLLKDTYFHLKDWHALEMLLPQLEKYSVFTEAELEILSIMTYQGLLIQAGKENISLIWTRVPKKLRASSTLLDIYIPLLAEKSPEEAEELLRPLIQRNPADILIRHYGLISVTAEKQREKQLETAENLLKSHPKNAVLLLTLGRLCIKNQLWGKARTYLEASLQINPLTETCQTLGGLLEQLGEVKDALHCYQQGFLLLHA